MRSIYNEEGVGHLGEGPIVREVLSTRLFPKFSGLASYKLTGIAKRCDWVVLSDAHAPNVEVRRNRDTNNPQHVFLSLRQPFAAIKHFGEKILPDLRSNFVLVTGSEDVTVPQQLDARWRPFNVDERAIFQRILDHPYLIHWYAENLDQKIHEKVSPIPLGLVFADGQHPDNIVHNDVPRLASRPIRAFCSHRHRDGQQWQIRKKVSELAVGPWSSFTTHPDSELPEAEFYAQLQTHSFVVCVEGGGLDPSPKAWATLLHGAIPIIRKTTVTPAYEHLPVALVEKWDADALSVGQLKQWLERLQPWFDDREKRSTVLQRLSLEYWWDIIVSGEPSNIGGITF